MPTSLETRRIYYGDNLPIMQTLPSDSVDLIYLDPPFNSKRNYNMPLKDDLGRMVESQAHVFSDTWEWEQKYHASYLQTIAQQHYSLAHTLKGIDAVIRGGGVDDRQKSGVFAYLVHMAVRLLEMKRLLKATGSLYLHCDPTMSHYLKILLDAVFGVGNFRNEIVWCYATPSGARMRFPAKHDTIFFYTKSAKYPFNIQYIPHKSGLHNKGKIWNKKTTSEEDTDRVHGLEGLGKKIEDWWIDIYPVDRKRKERVGYPTQKPLALLKRIIQASSNEGEVVFDPFCGCGTAILAAEELGRQWIGIDITYHAVKILRERFEGSKTVLNLPHVLESIHVVGAPYSPQEALVLAELDKHEFEKFAVKTFGGLHSGKQGSDGGVDGYFSCYTQAHPTDESPQTPRHPQAQQGIIQVKGGKQGNWRQTVSALHADANSRPAVLITAHDQPAARSAAQGYQNLWVYTIEEVMHQAHQQDFSLKQPT